MANTMHNKSILLGKRILLGISGGIAAYKAADLVRRLKDRGAAGRAILTPAASALITPLPRQALSGNPAMYSMQSQFNNSIAIIYPVYCA